MSVFQNQLLWAVCMQSGPHTGVCMGSDVQEEPTTSLPAASTQLCSKERAVASERRPSPRARQSRSFVSNLYLVSSGPTQSSPSSLRMREPRHGDGTLGLE